VTLHGEVSVLTIRDCRPLGSAKPQEPLGFVATATATGLVVDAVRNRLPSHWAEQERLLQRAGWRMPVEDS
jgi:hypothetical protein